MLVKDIQRLEVFQNNCLRRILNVRLLDRIPLPTLRFRACHQHPVESIIQKRRLQLFGHISRMSPTKIARSVLLPLPPTNWKKRRGGQSKTWIKTVAGDLSRVHPLYDIQAAIDDAQNRVQWRGLIRDVVLAPKATGRSLPYQR